MLCYGGGGGIGVGAVGVGVGAMHQSRDASNHSKIFVRRLGAGFSVS